MIVQVDGNTSSNKDLIRLVGLENIMEQSLGNSSIGIGLIDGPVDTFHPEFKSLKFKSFKTSYKCKNNNSIACIHGTFMLGILSAKRNGSSLGICPKCEIILRPVFFEFDASNQGEPNTSPKELSKAIIETVDVGAKIINLSMTINASNIVLLKEIQDAYEYARSNGVIIIIAAGDLGNIGFNQLLNNRWIIPVIACNNYGRIVNASNIGIFIRQYGVMAPGVNIESTSPDKNYTIMSGSSVACTVVTGIIGLLWSIFPKMSSEQLIYSIRNSTKSTGIKNIIPGIVNAQKAYNYLNNL